MATNSAGRRCRNAYAMLLRLYPRPFRERFGEGLTQTFGDLCRDRQQAGRVLFTLALWIFLDTLVGIAKENATHMTQMTKTITRVALVALALLMVPLIASRLIADWNWKPGGFVFVYILFFATGMAYALIARRLNAWAYKAGVALALVTGFGLGWSNMVHVADSENPANLIYFSVLAIGCVGAVIARLQPRGLSLTLFAMAATLFLIAVTLPSGAPPLLARNMAIGHAASVVLFTASGLLFRRASSASFK